MIATLLLGLCASAGQAGARSEAPATPEAIAAVRDRWLEEVELDLPGAVLSSGPWIERGEVTDPTLVALYARALHAAGEDERALKLLEATDSPVLALAAARIALDRDEIDRARALLMAVPGSDPPLRFPAEPEGWLLLGRAHARAGDPARAEPLLAEFVRRAPHDVEAPGAWFLLVECARARGDGAEVARRAESHARSAEWHAFYRARRLQVRENPNEPLPRLGLAQLWLAVGEIDRADRTLAELLRIAPEFCRGLELLAEVDRRAGRIAESRARCDAALACDPALVDVHLTRARLERDAGEAAASAASYARYRELGGTKAL